MEKPLPSYFKVSWIAGAGLLMVLLVAYFHVLQNGFIWDDDRHLTILL